LTVPGERYALHFDFGSWFGGSAGAEQRLSVEVRESAITLSNFAAVMSTAGPMNMVSDQLYFWADATNSTVTFRDVSLQTASTDGHLDNVSIEWVGPSLPRVIPAD
jgi:hypothetical protein